MGQQVEDYLTSSFGGYPYGAGANNPPQQPSLMQKAKLYYDLAKQGYGAAKGMLSGDDDGMLQGLNGVRRDWQTLHPANVNPQNPIGLRGIRRPQTDWETLEYPLHGVGGK